MGELGHLLELLHRAPARYVSVRATIRLWRQQPRLEEAFLRAVRERGGTLFAAGDEPGEPPPEEWDALVRLWYEGRDRFREEYEPRSGPEEPRTVVVDGDTWWLVQPREVLHNHGDASHGVGRETPELLLDPSRLSAEYELRVEGSCSLRGRPAIRVRGTPRLSESLYPPLGLPLGADEVELLVDAERGLVLSALAFLGGAPFWLAEVLELCLDERFPQETFRYEPPPGVVVRGTARPQLEDLPVEEVARRSPFTVWVPSRVPAGFRLRASFWPGLDADDGPAAFLQYQPDDGTHYLTLNELPAREGLPRAGERLERGGHELVIVSRPDERGLPLRVVTVRGDVRIELQSDLCVDTVLELAASLVPAPTEPPGLP